MHDDDDRPVILGYRLRGEPEAQTIGTSLASARHAMETVDDAARGARNTSFVDIAFNLPDGRRTYTMIRISDIVEIAWSEVSADG